MSSSHAPPAKPQPAPKAETKPQPAVKAGARPQPAVKAGAKPQPAPKAEDKPPAAADPNSRRDLPTASHVAARENAEVPPDDETMSDLPGTFQTSDSTVPARNTIDTQTMSDQTDPKP